MAENQTRVLLVATSYPRTPSDWQGLFIRKIVEALSARRSNTILLWAPEGPIPTSVTSACDNANNEWLAELADRGGIAHLLRAHPLLGLRYGAGLLRRLRAEYLSRRDQTDIFHINWLQNALPLYGLGARALITVLGTDMKLLQLPGMVTALRAVLRSNRCVLAPNAEWMRKPLEAHFSDVAEIEPVNFGIDPPWFDVECAPPDEINHWLCVLRVTQQKIGQLFEWGEAVFQGPQQLHLVGPNQGGLNIPEWVNYHGALSAAELLRDLYPKCTGFITLSEHSEGKPQVLLETMAAGMPVIASRTAAHSEVVHHGETGFLVETESEFNNALSLVAEPSVHKRLASQSKALSQRDYGTWQNCADRYQKLYETLM